MADWPGFGEAEKAGTRQPDVDERRRDARQHALDAADIDVADDAAIVGPRHHQFAEPPALHEGDARFARPASIRISSVATAGLCGERGA